MQVRRRGGRNQILVIFWTENTFDHNLCDGIVLSSFLFRTGSLDRSEVLILKVTDAQCTVLHTIPVSTKIRQCQHFQPGHANYGPLIFPECCLAHAL